MAINPKPESLIGAGEKALFGIVLPWCIFGLLIWLILSTSPRSSGEAAGFALLGFEMAAGIGSVIGIALNLWVLFIRWKSRVLVFFGGCIAPFILMILLLAGAPK